MTPAGTTDATRPRGALSVVVVIARYPPHHRGGYELRCRDVCRELARRGHRVTVLTSAAGASGESDDSGVRVIRALHPWEHGVRNGLGGVLSFVAATARDCARLRAVLRESGAGVLAYWHQLGLTSALLAVRPPRGCGVLCDVSSDWLLDAATTGGNWFRLWEAPSRSALRRRTKAALSALAALLGAPTVRPRFPPGRAYYTSADRRARHAAGGVNVADAALIRSGIHLDLFPFRPERAAGGPRKLLFLGRIKRLKGLHTAAVALSRLPADVCLDVAGAAEDPEYLAEVGEIVRATGTGGRVRISVEVPHDSVPELLRGADVLVFPSEQPEAFSRLVLEAFASGTPVVGTTLGGTGEVLVEGETGLTFAPGNAHELADQIRRLLGDGALRERLVRNARRLVEERYSLGFTVDSIEALLREARDGAA